jgi:uncharacterized delta-60 repeat protein
MIKALLISTSLFYICFFGFSQPGSIINSFDTKNNSIADSNNIMNWVNNLLLTKDGSILAIGGGGQYQSARSEGLVKLLPNGRKDDSFHFDPNLNTSNLKDAVEDSTGHFIVGIQKTSFQTPYLIRIDQNGAVTDTFGIGNGPNGDVHQLYIDRNNKIYVLGNFTEYAGQTTNGFCRINLDGSFDTTFQQMTGLNSGGTILGLLELKNGNLLVYGKFYEFNGINSRGMIILNSDGTLATSIQKRDCYGAAYLATGELIVSLHTNNIGGHIIYEADSNWAFTRYGTFPEVKDRIMMDDRNYPTRITPDHWGGFYIENVESFNPSIRGLRRIDKNGLMDTSFLNAYPVTGRTTGFLYDRDSAIYLSDNVGIIDYPQYAPVFRVELNGQFDHEFTFAQESQSKIINTGDMLQVSDSNIVIGGNFEVYSGVESPGFIAVDKVDGAVEKNIAYQSTSFPNVQTFEKSGTDKYYIGGDFLLVGSASGKSIVRMNNDGSQDLTFQSPFLANENNTVKAIAELPDGRVLVGGTLVSFSLTKNLQLLSANGTMDLNFNNTTQGPTTQVHDIAVSGTSIFVAGAFTSYNGSSVSSLIKINVAGTLDPSFSPTFNGLVREIEFDNQGRFVCIGDFTTVNGQAATGICRLLANGQIDVTFNLGTGFSGKINDFDIQTDNKIVLVGDFTSYNGEIAHYLVRINNLGQKDPYFIADQANKPIFRIEILDDETALIRGAFQKYGEDYRQYLAKIELKCLLAEAPSLAQNTIDLCYGHEFSDQVSSRLHGSTRWAWYRDSVSNPNPEYTNSISDTLYANAKFYVRAEGGCAPVGAFDSILVHVVMPDTSYISDSVCYSFNWNLTGLDYDSSGVYSTVLQNIRGCDSLVYLDLFVNRLDSITVPIIKDSTNMYTSLPATIYKWFNCLDNSYVATTLVPSWTPPFTGDFYVQVVNGQLGCRGNSGCLFFEVAIVVIDNSGIEELNGSLTRIYPNPATFMLNISSTENWNQFEIKSFDGKIIGTGTIETARPIDISLLSNGVYFIVLSNEGRKAQTRFVKI